MPQNNASTELLSEVAETIKNSSSAIRSRLKDTLVEREVSSRVDLLDRGLLKLREARAEIKKMKPDQVSFDGGGQKTETWSKDAHEKKVKAEEQVEKLEKAIELALSGDSFDKLKDLVK